VEVEVSIDRLNGVLAPEVGMGQFAWFGMCFCRCRGDMLFCLCAGIAVILGSLQVDIETSD